VEGIRLMSKNKKSSGFTVVSILVITIVLLAIAGVSWRVLASNKNTTDNHANNKQTNLSSNNSKQTTDPYAGWKTYCSTTVKACFKYPSDWAQSKYGGFENSTATEYVSLNDPTTKDGGSGTAYIASIEDFNSSIKDLKILGIIVDNKPSFNVYNTSYISSNIIKVGETKDIDYVNHMFLGKTGLAGLVGTPAVNGYASMHTIDQAKSWFNSNEAGTVLKVLQSFYYQ
jgi:hypothetical protein